MGMYRAQILLEPYQHRLLCDIASRQGRSISALVRELLHERLTELQEEQRSEAQRYCAALDRIQEHKSALLKRRGGHPLKADINLIMDKSREDRDESIIDITGLSSN